MRAKCIVKMPYTCIWCLTPNVTLFGYSGLLAGSNSLKTFSSFKIIPFVWLKRTNRNMWGPFITKIDFGWLWVSALLAFYPTISSYCGFASKRNLFFFSDWTLNILKCYSALDKWSPSSSISSYDGVASFSFYARYWLLNLHSGDDSLARWWRRRGTATAGQPVASLAVVTAAVCMHTHMHACMHACFFFLSPEISLHQPPYLSWYCSA